MNRRIASLMIVGAGCLWGTMGLFVRRMGDMGLRSMEIVEARSILSATAA